MPALATNQYLSIGNGIFGTGLYNTQSLSSAATSRFNMGISTTSPYAKLSVTSTDVASTTLAIAPVAGQTGNIIDIYRLSGNLDHVLTTSGRFGLGTTTPYAMLSVNATTGVPSFAIGSTTGTSFIVDKTQNVGIGSSTPGTLLSLGNTGANTINISATATSTFGSGININTGCFAISGVCLSTSGGGGSGTVNSGTTGQFPYYAANGTTLTATSSIFVTTNQTIGIGTTTPISNVKLTVTSNGSVADQFLLEDTSAVANQHMVSFGNVNGQLVFNTMLDSGATSTKFVISNAGRVGIGTTTPGTTLSVEGSSTLGNVATAGYYNATSTTATSTFSGPVQVGTNTDADSQWLWGPASTGWASGYKQSDGSFRVATGTAVGTNDVLLLLKGHAKVSRGSSATPVLSSCGTSPSISTDASDFAGTVTVGSVSATGCTITF
ncbi:MAG: hypothetical protein V4481_05700, partial [Patescibacteria group bacterium]